MCIYIYIYTYMCIYIYVSVTSLYVFAYMTISEHWAAYMMCTGHILTLKVQLARFMAGAEFCDFWDMKQ